LDCVDRPGIVAGVATELATMGCNIIESNQHRDARANRFFMRIAFSAPTDVDHTAIERGLKSVIERFEIKARVIDADRAPKIIIMLSKLDHAMLHLLYQIRVGWLKAEVVAIVSNHNDSEQTVQLSGIPFYCWPVDKNNKAAQETQMLDLVHKTGADLIILARYMQVLSDSLSTRLYGRVINIHHSFLPSFKGAKPYHQAYDRGVKLIGATSHYVTPDLDEGPIIEQETERVSHSMTVDEYVATGRDIESRVLARAVKLHLEHRVMLNGHKTIVFK
jgi:formyltetrahydrofolate deformylase